MTTTPRGKIKHKRPLLKLARSTQQQPDNTGVHFPKKDTQEYGHGAEQYYGRDETRRCRKNWSYVRGPTHPPMPP